MENTAKKTGHPVLGIVLGIIGIVLSFSAFLFGVIGGGVAALLGVLAVVIGVLARKGGRGTGAIVAGILAIILAVVMTRSSINLYQALHEKALEHTDIAPLMAKSTDKPYTGLIGIVMQLKDADADALTKEIEALNKLNDDKTENKEEKTEDKTEDKTENKEDKTEDNNGQSGDTGEEKKPEDNSSGN